MSELYSNDLTEASGRIYSCQTISDVQVFILFFFRTRNIKPSDMSSLPFSERFDRSAKVLWSTSLLVKKDPDRLS